MRLRRLRRSGGWLVAGVAMTAACLAACGAGDPTPSPPPPTLLPTASATPAAPTADAARAYPAPATADTTAPTTGAAPGPYPGPLTRTPRAYPLPAAPPTAVAEVFLPVFANPPAATATPTLPPTATATPTPTPTIDFDAVRAELAAQGQALAFSKIGFHTGVGGNRNGLGVWMRRLDAAGVPFTLKSADDAGPLVEAQEIARASGVPHVLVYRKSGDQYDTPDYSLPPREAAQRHWRLHKESFPPELDPSLIWIETINEVDRNRAAWLGDFAVATAQLALADGFKWAAFGWSSGEPEPSDWERPSVLAYLRLAAANPDRLAVALHEYSFLRDDITDAYPFKVGRFLQLFAVCDRHGIPRPTVIITEWGWEYNSVPEAGRAVEDMRWAAALYAPYPEVLGAAVWYLGGFFGEIHDQTQKLIAPATELNLGTYFAIQSPPDRAPPDPNLYRP